MSKWCRSALDNFDVTGALDETSASVKGQTPPLCTCVRLVIYSAALVFALSPAASTSPLEREREATSPATDDLRVTSIQSVTVAFSQVTTSPFREMRLEEIQAEEGEKRIMSQASEITANGAISSDSNGQTTPFAGGPTSGKAAKDLSSLVERNWVKAGGERDHGVVSSYETSENVERRGIFDFLRPGYTSSSSSRSVTTWSSENIDRRSSRSTSRPVASAASFRLPPETESQTNPGYLRFSTTRGTEIHKETKGIGHKAFDAAMSFEAMSALNSASIGHSSDRRPAEGGARDIASFERRHEEETTETSYSSAIQPDVRQITSVVLGAESDSKETASTILNLERAAEHFGLKQTSTGRRERPDLLQSDAPLPRGALTTVLHDNSFQVLPSENGLANVTRKSLPVKAYHRLSDTIVLNRSRSQVGNTISDLAPANQRTCSDDPPITSKCLRQSSPEYPVSKSPETDAPPSNITNDHSTTSSSSSSLSSS